MNNDSPIPARAVRSLLEEILAVLDAPRPAPARVGHIVIALQHLLRGPGLAAGDIDTVAAGLHAQLASAAAAGPGAWDDQCGPYESRESAEEAYEYLARGAGSSTLAGRTQFLAETIIDALDEFSETGAYDRQLAGRLAAMLSATDMGVIASWVRRAAGDVPELGEGRLKSFLDPPQPVRLRRFAVLRVMLRPRAAALLLEDLAYHADINRVAVGVVLKSCAVAHVERR